MDRTAVFVDPLLGAQVGPFHIVSRIGAGASGVVYEGRTATREQVAIKVLKAEVALDGEYVTRMMTEARTVAQLRHPSVVHIHTVGVLPDGRPYVVMEYLDGDTLEGWSRSEGTVAIDDVCRLGADVCSVLSAVHALDVVHRDVKAENIFLARVAGAGRRVKLLDFGIAKVARQAALVGQETHPGAFVGTPAVMSPEQIRGERVTPQTDLYALGAVLYRLLTHHDPFEGESVTEVLLQQLTVTAPDPRVVRPDTPPSLAALIASLLAKNAVDRPPSAAAVEQQLRAAIRAVPLGDEPLDRATRSERPPDTQADPSHQTDPSGMGPAPAGVTGPTDQALALSTCEPTAPFPVYLASSDDRTQQFPVQPPAGTLAKRLPWWPFAAAAGAMVVVGMVVVLGTGASEPYLPPPLPPNEPTAAEPSRPPGRARITAKKVISRADALKNELRAQQPPPARAAGTELSRLRRRATKTSDPEELAAILASLDAWERRYLSR